MTAKRRNSSVFAGVTCAAIILGSSYSSAAVIDLRNATRAEPSLIHHYTFEDTQADYNNLRLLDRAGTLDLIEYARNLPPGAKIVYETGFDALSVGGSSVHVTNLNSRGDDLRSIYH